MVRRSALAAWRISSASSAVQRTKRAVRLTASFSIRCILIPARKQLLSSDTKGRAQTPSQPFHLTFDWEQPKSSFQRLKKPCSSQLFTTSRSLEPHLLKKESGMIKT